MTRQNKSKRGNRRTSKNSGQSRGNSGPPVNATTYNGPVISRNQLSGMDTTVINVTCRIPFILPVAMADGYTFKNITNDINDIVTLFAGGDPSGQEIPAMLGNYNAYRVLAIQARYMPAYRYYNTTSLLNAQSGAFWCVLVRTGANHDGADPSGLWPENFNSVIVQPGVRQLTSTDPWCDAFEYRGSSCKPLTWRAKGIEDMEWRSMVDTSTDASGGLHIGLLSSITDTEEIIGFHTITWRIQLKNMVARMPPTFLTMERFKKKEKPNQEVPLMMNLTLGPKPSVEICDQPEINKNVQKTVHNRRVRVVG